MPVKRTCISLLFLLLITLVGCNTPPEGQNNATAASVAYIENKGSDTMVNLALAWAEQYQQEHPEVRISVTGGGTGTGIAALINGTTDIANASRQIKKEESQAAENNGTTPVEYVVAKDAIAVVVNPENPVSQLTLQQLSDIYSGKITNWQQVGGENRPIVKLSRETNSGTHVYFVETVLRLGQKDNKTLLSRDTLLLSSSEGISAEIRQNPNAIGYDGLGYVTGDMKVIAVAKTPGGPYVLPNADSVNNGTYPIARDLYIYTGQKLKQAAIDYLKWITSPEAQGIVTKLGFVPIAPSSK